MPVLSCSFGSSSHLVSSGLSLVLTNQPPPVPLLSRCNSLPLYVFSFFFLEVCQFIVVMLFYLGYSKGFTLSPHSPTDDAASGTTGSSVSCSRTLQHSRNGWGSNHHMSRCPCHTTILVVRHLALPPCFPALGHTFLPPTPQNLSVYDSSKFGERNSEKMRKTEGLNRASRVQKLQYDRATPYFKTLKQLFIFQVISFLPVRTLFILHGGVN